MPKQPADALGEAIRTVSLDMAANIGCKVLEALARLAATMEMPPQGRQSVSLCLLTKAEEVERKLLGADPAFADKSAEDWRLAIGCSKGLVAKLPVWKGIQEQRRALAAEVKGPAPRAMSLTDKLQLARGEAAKYREAANMWKATAREIQNDLDAALTRESFNASLVAYARARKASLAKYERKRGRG